MKEEQILLKRLFSVLRAEFLGKRFMDIIPDEFTENDFREGIETITDALEKRCVVQFLEFHDENNFRVRRAAIKTYRSGESVEGFPIIVLNEFMPEMASCVGERTLYYEDEKTRDKDIEEMRFYLN